MTVNVIGGGLAGCECAYQIARRGIKVNLYEMKPHKKTQAHKTDGLAELICSNSFKAARLESAAGMLKEEMRMLNSLLMECADLCSVPAGGALAVDRELFSSEVTRRIKENKYINVIEEEVLKIPKEGITVIASGPLTSDVLAKEIEKLCGGALNFFDAAAPIITSESIDFDSAFFASRYGKGSGEDYINCPLSKDEYENFAQELIKAERTPLHNVDIQNPKVYEGCMPIEIMAQRGKDTIRFGPMKPVGLTDPKTGHRPWAVLQLRKENKEATLYNLVGFQTNLKFPEQRRVFGLIKALRKAEYVRYGVMHRNTFIDSPKLLDADYSYRENDKLYFAGQITGVEGYIESASSGLIAGINVARKILGKDKIYFPLECMIGSLSNYISDKSVNNFQPMGANVGILPSLDEVTRDKKLKATKYANRSVEKLEKFIKENNINVEESI